VTAVYILGLNAYHGDSSAAIIKDGQLIAAVEEERFTRIKHWAGFPREAIRYCLQEAGVGVEDLNYVAVNRNTRANLHKKVLFALRNRPSLGLVRDRLCNWQRVGDMRQTLAQEFSVAPNAIKARFVNVEHHRAHLASSFFVSGFDEATLVSVDGFGDFTSTMVAKGKGSHIEPLYEVNYPHSLGLFYSAFTQFLGFPKYGDEYKVMGLSAFGKPAYLDKMQEVVKLKPSGRFELNLKFFQHYRQGTRMQWHNTAPKFGQIYSDSLCGLFGKPRGKDDEITDHYKNIASSVQAAYEEAFFHILHHAHRVTGRSNLSLAGGCALNSLANGKIFDKAPCKEIYIPPAAHDGGGSIGAAYYLYHNMLGKPRGFAMRTAFWGPRYGQSDIHQLLADNRIGMDGFSVTDVVDTDELVKIAARYLSEGKIVGWFQGRMEWGPRALGNRSILADPRKKEMKDLLNSKIKMREPFRPFAPSVLQAYVHEYFEREYPDPFMLKVYPIRAAKRSVIPAVTHVDGTGRLQTVDKNENPLYWKLIDEFRKLTGVAVVLNTSFNENEPIVCKPEEALDCFLRTKMDVLILDKWVIARRSSQE
jgi:carbamoyltransferase